MDGNGINLVTLGDSSSVDEIEGDSFAFSSSVEEAGDKISLPIPSACGSYVSHSDTTELTDHNKSIGESLEEIFICHTDSHANNHAVIVNSNTVNDNCNIRDMRSEMCPKCLNICFILLVLWNTTCF